MMMARFAEHMVSGSKLLFSNRTFRSSIAVTAALPQTVSGGRSQDLPSRRHMQKKHIIKEI